MKFYYENTPVSSFQEPPEEIFASLSGACCSWQIAVVLVCFIALLLSETHQDFIRYSINFLESTCFTKKTSKCTTNETKCENVSNKNFSTSFPENFLWICGKQNLKGISWLYFCHTFALAVGYIVSGVTIRKLGIKFTCVVFIPLQCLFGLLLFTTDSIETFLIYVFIGSLFSSALDMVPQLAVCDCVGNRWRTLAMGIIFLPYTVTTVIFPFLFASVNNLNGLLGTASILPLLLLAPLMFYEDSLNHIVLSANPDRIEKLFYRIARLNNFPLSSNAKIRPVKIIPDSDAKRSTFLDVWKLRKTRRAYSALLCIWFLLGYCRGYYIFHNYFNHLDYIITGLLAAFGCILTIILCHYVSQKYIICITSPYYFIINAILDLVRSIILTSLFNLTPRMFPTEMRSFYTGVSYSVHTFGLMLSTLTNDTSKFLKFTAGICLLFLFPILFVFSSFLLWDVHNRELPDFLVDCVHFETFYKPTRYFSIDEDGAESEVKVVNYDE